MNSLIYLIRIKDQGSVASRPAPQLSAATRSRARVPQWTAKNSDHRELGMLWQATQRTANVGSNIVMLQVLEFSTQLLQLLKSGKMTIKMLFITWLLIYLQNKIM